MKTARLYSLFALTLISTFLSSGSFAEIRIQRLSQRQIESWAYSGNIIAGSMFHVNEIADALRWGGENNLPVTYFDRVKIEELNRPQRHYSDSGSYSVTTGRGTHVVNRGQTTSTVPSQWSMNPVRRLVLHVWDKQPRRTAHIMLTVVGDGVMQFEEFENIVKAFETEGITVLAITSPTSNGCNSWLVN